ncbi:hypothetical protein B0H17DRAFT_1090141 [Mycena rosella]|uniref:Uncharacterized protein n=1 Tax=Mycena rosella TaxID=1033263 RepID=A0AAD7CVN0_MYCRO|nr:hypothetical protein B0H17DRAFT_1090141 [Mycena rosella]
MARAWPLIELLSTPPDPAYRLSLRVTLEGVYAFATHCPLLRLLNLAFDATVVPTIKINGRKRVSQHSLGQLHVAYSLIDEPRPVAEFLSTIFPHLYTVKTLYTELPEDITDAQLLASHTGWRKVRDVLRDV